MRTLKCYIIDDESYSIERLTENIRKMPELELIGSNTKPKLAIKEITSSKKTDIVFLDIDMPELNGMEVASLLPKGIAIIFVTGHVNQAYNAFENDAVDFILKPYSFERFVRAVRKVEVLLSNTVPFASSSKNDKLFIKSGFKNTFKQISLEEIVNVEAFDHHVFLHTLKEKSIVNASMKGLEDTLPAWLFVRTHRTHIINIDLIKEINGTQILMENNLIIPLSKSYKDVFLKKIQDRMIKTS